MILSGPQISSLLDSRVVENALRSNINAASLDVSIGDYILLNVELQDYTVDPAKTEPDQFLRVQLPYAVPPGAFFLTHTVERVNLPDTLSAQVVTKSSAARIGLDHATAGFCDAGFSGQITLEFVNHNKNRILIYPGAKLVQLKFFPHEHAGAYSYSKLGQYGGSQGAVLSKGIK